MMRECLALQCSDGGDVSSSCIPVEGMSIQTRKESFTDCSIRSRIPADTKETMIAFHKEASSSSARLISFSFSSKLLCWVQRRDIVLLRYHQLQLSGFERKIAAVYYIRHAFSNAGWKDDSFQFWFHIDQTLKLTRPWRNLLVPLTENLHLIPAATSSAKEKHVLLASATNNWYLSPILLNTADASCQPHQLFPS